eukprot:jgi/Mesvir1/20708/Mv14904-RA.2
MEGTHFSMLTTRSLSSGLHTSVVSSVPSSIGNVPPFPRPEHRAKRIKPSVVCAVRGVAYSAKLSPAGTTPFLGPLSLRHPASRMVALGPYWRWRRGSMSQGVEPDEMSPPVQPQPPGTNRLAHGLMLLSQIVFSVGYLTSSSVLKDNPDPLSFALLREFLSTVAMLALAVSFEGPQRMQSSADLLSFVILGALSFGVVAGFTIALSLVPDFNCAIAQPLIPVAALLLEAATGMRALTLRSSLGVALAVAGAMAVTAAAATAPGVGTAAVAGGGAESTSLVAEGAAKAFFGNSLLGLEVLCYAGLMVYLKVSGISRRYGSITTTAYYYAFGSVMCLVLTLGSHGWDPSRVLASLAVYNSPLAWAVIGYAVLFVTVFTYVSITYANQRLSATTVSVYTTLQPILVALFTLIW